MTAYDFGDVLLVPFPFTDRTGVKQRPAVVVNSERYRRERPDLKPIPLPPRASAGQSLGGELQCSPVRVNRFTARDRVCMEAEHRAIAQELRDSVLAAGNLTKRMKVRSLLSKFGFQKRSDANTGVITEALIAAGVVINPAVIRLGTDWQLDIDDWIYLSAEEALTAASPDTPASDLPKGWNADGWFDRLESLNLRSEKEVEIKLIVPLLSRLGYSEDDRYDGMPCAASLGSKKTTYTADFALHNVEEAGLKGQVLLIAEAKKEDRLKRPTELQNAFRQAKSYAMWTQCRHLLVTDGRLIVAYEILRAGLVESEPIFRSQRQDLKSNFAKLYARVSKPVLTRFYMKLVSAVEEAR